MFGKVHEEKEGKWNTHAINHFMALRLSLYRKKSGLLSPRTRQCSPTSVSGRLYPTEIPHCSYFSQIWFSCHSDFPKQLLQNWFKVLCSGTMRQAIFRRKRLSLQHFFCCRLINLPAVNKTHSSLETHSTQQPFHFSSFGTRLVRGISRSKKRY